jgi:hypothetical protein
VIINAWQFVGVFVMISVCFVVHCRNLK